MSDGSDRSRVSVFVSYRRDDSPDATDRLTIELRRELGADSVFLDIDDIEIGARFARVVEEWVGRCDVLLAVIGPDWLDARDDEGGRRLDDPSDYVRLEIEAALRRDIRVVPVLMNGARLPKRDQLPQTLAPLVEYNAIELTRRHWDIDVDELIAGLQRLADPPAADAAQRRRSHGSAAPEKPPDPEAVATPAVPAAAPTGSRGQPSPAHRPRSPWRRRSIWMSALVVLAGAGAATAILLGGGGLRTVNVKLSGAEDVAVGGGAVWLTGVAGVTELSARTGTQVGAPIEDSGGAGPIAVGDGAVWVANANGTVTHIDPATRSVIGAPAAVGTDPAALAIANGTVWVLSTLSQNVARINARSGRPVGPPIDLHVSGANAIAASGDQVWVAGGSGAKIERIDAATGKLIAPVADTLGAQALAPANGGFWVLNAVTPGTATEGSSVARYDSAGNQLGQPTAVGATAIEIAAGLGSVWVTDSQANTVTRLSADTGAVTGAPIATGISPFQIAAGDGGVWVVNTAGQGSVTWIRP